MELPTMSKRRTCLYGVGVLLLTSLTIVYLFSVKEVPLLTQSRSPLIRQGSSSSNFDYKHLLDSTSGAPDNTEESSSDKAHWVTSHREQKQPLGAAANFKGKVSPPPASQLHDLKVMASASPERKDAGRQTELEGKAGAKRTDGEKTKPEAGRAKTKREQFPWLVDESSRHPEEVHHIVFVKVHKAASTTVFNVFIRFATSRQLNVMFPYHSNTLSQYSPRLSALLPHPKIPPFRFDILCNHVVFNYTKIRPYFPSDTKYVAILRDPWQQVQSAYHYYTTRFKVKYLRNSFSFDKFIHNQSGIEPSNPLNSFTNNRMSIDLGLPPSLVKNASYVTTFLRHLDSVFHLVLIADRFDESMVLMKRLLRWTTKDVVYRKLNSRKAKKEKIPEPDPDLKRQIRRFNLFDVAVYEHYAKIFDEKIKKEGQSFWDEVQVFVNITKQISKFCDADKTVSKLIISRSKWNEQFTMRRAECVVLSVKEIKLNSVARNRQLARLVPLMHNEIK